MGEPRPAPRVFVVAGTNGKGSVVATLCALLAELGYRVGSYTSPHLLQYNERVRVNGEMASDRTLLDGFEVVERARNGVSLTYFEYGTLAAFDILSKAGLDYAVMEVGLGGRLDAVNLLDADCAVITPIGLDHQAYLGNDRESIGAEKAGIIRSGRPVISGEPSPPRSIAERARQLGAPLKRLGREFSVEQSPTGIRLSLGGRALDLPPPSLPGPHQMNNLAVSVAALLELLPSAAENPEALARGLGRVALAGRFERLAQRPAVWVDVGHNPMAAQAVARALREAMAAERIDRCTCVIGMLADKDAEGVGEALAPVIGTWCCAGLEGERSQSGGELAARLRPAAGGAGIRVFDRVAEAFESALGQAGDDEAVLVFGSFVTASEAIGFWRSRNHGN
jgi:dihydrofolate synthase/folylpolyglutamate synthase